MLEDVAKKEIDLEYRNASGKLMTQKEVYCYHYAHAGLQILMLDLSRQGTQQEQNWAAQEEGHGGRKNEIHGSRLDSPHAGPQEWTTKNQPELYGHLIEEIVWVMWVCFTSITSII